MRQLQNETPQAKLEGEVEQAGTEDLDHTSQLAEPPEQMTSSCYPQCPVLH
jgi:hypothetical protein